VATVTVNEDGVAVLTPGSPIAKWFFSVAVIVPGEWAAANGLPGPGVTPDGPVVVKPEDGELYLRALPFAFTGGYIGARFIED
jgi:hypothetical protein